MCGIPLESADVPLLPGQSLHLSKWKKKYQYFNLETMTSLHQISVQR